MISPAVITRLAKREFRFAPGVVFLNHASFGPVPESGRRAVESLLATQGRLSADPEVDDESYSLLAQSKRHFGRMIGQRAQRVAFAQNASVGINSILWGLALRNGERLLIPAVEFPSLVYAAKNVADKRGLRIEKLPCPDGYLDTKTLRRALRQKAAVLAMSWVQYFNGWRHDLQELTEICHNAGCFVLADLTQGAGAVPFSMQRQGVDAVVCGTQKWLFGQTGGGFFAVASAPIRRVNPIFAGWLGYDWRYRWERLQTWNRRPHRDGRVWEVGTYPFYSIRLIHAGLRLLDRVGVRRVFSRIDSLTGILAEHLATGEYHVWRPSQRSHRSGIVTIRGPRIAALHRYLTGRRIYTSLREGTIRVSPHFHNTTADIDALVEGIRQFARGGYRSTRRK